ncbi:MAG: hypothetical protein WAV76_07995 [Bacteroidota bacterium]
MNPAPLELIAYLKKHYPDSFYHVVYEAGFCGFRALRIFRQNSVGRIVINPADPPTFARWKHSRDKIHPHS